MSKMSKPKYNGPTGGKPAHSDSKKQSAKKGPSEATTQKRVGGSNHKQISGPSEMKAMPGGMKHKAITGPNEASKGAKFGGDKMKSVHVSEHVGGDQHGYLGSAGSSEALKKGFSSLEKVETGKETVRKTPIYGNDSSKGEDQD